MPGHRSGRELPVLVCWVSRLASDGGGRCRGLRSGRGHRGCSQRSREMPAAPAGRSGSGCSTAPRSRALAMIWLSQPRRPACSGGPALPGGRLSVRSSRSLRFRVGNVVPQFTQGGLGPHSGGHRHSLGKRFTRRQRDQSPQGDAHPHQGFLEASEEVWLANEMPQEAVKSHGLEGTFAAPPLGGSFDYYRCSLLFGEERTF